jgi:hypothetical protein
MARRSLRGPTKVDVRLVLDRLAVERIKSGAGRAARHTVHLVSGASLSSWGFTRRSRMSRSKFFW